MATARRTPSGMWKCRVYSHTTSDGKKHYRAFTAPTKQEAEQEAARFSGSADRAARVDLTVAEAISGYIRAKDGVLSPSTIRGYRKLERNYYTDIGRERIRRLTTERVQIFISDHAKKLSAKSVKNIYGLLTAAVAFYMPEKHFNVKLPARQITRAQSVTEADVLALYAAARDWLRICIGLSAFGSLRRGEICSLVYGDITDAGLYVHTDMVVDEHGVWQIKEMPKTEQSIRLVRTIPRDVYDLMGTGAPDERIIKRTPNEVTKYFIQLRDDLSMTCRFQDMRGFFASSAPLQGVVDIYLADMGGWRRGSSVIKEHYQKNMDPVSAAYADKMRTHFDDLLKSMT